MALRLPDRWVWDFWLTRHREEHHVFYLQAPRSLGDPLLRHHNASIGHAVSRDLRRWRVLPDAIRPGSDGRWDDLATWTGSVIARDGSWHMLYTGINRSEHGLIQRIGLATSDDLIHWRKHPQNPLLEADGRWYEQLDLDRWRDQSWRDPWLFAENGDVHALITARSSEGSPDGAGVVGQARSKNLVEWEVLPPLTVPGDFAQVECPQSVSVGGRQLILFSCLAEDHSASRRARTAQPGATGTFFFERAQTGGEFRPSDEPIATSDSRLGPLYAGKLVESEPKEWRFLAFRGGGDRHFVGELTDPLPVLLTVDGLRVLVEPMPAATR
jgi:beta-fructofuranosidase